MMSPYPILPFTLPFVLILAFLQGCSSTTRTAKPVEPKLALQILEQTLSVWESGEPIEVMQKQNPPIVVQDSDWQSGVILREYEVLGEPLVRDANLLVRVHLRFQEDSSKTTEKTVEYIVGTDPVLTVFRKIF